MNKQFLVMALVASVFVFGAGIAWANPIPEDDTVDDTSGDDSADDTTDGDDTEATDDASGDDDDEDDDGCGGCSVSGHGSAVSVLPIMMFVGMAALILGRRRN